jgi:hypothetical protein
MTTGYAPVKHSSGRTPRHRHVFGNLEISAGLGDFVRLQSADDEMDAKDVVPSLSCQDSWKTWKSANRHPFSN